MRQTSAVFLAVLSGWLPRAGSPFTQVPSAPSATGVTAPGPLPGGGERSTGDRGVVSQCVASETMTNA